MDQAGADVALDGAQVRGRHHAVRLAGLGHKVEQQDDPGPALGDRLADARNEQVGNDRGVERAGPEQDGVGALERGHGRREGGRRGRVELDAGQLLARHAHRALAFVDGAGDAASAEPHVDERRRVDLAPHRQDRLGGHDRLVKIAGDAGQGGQEEVAEGMADQAAAVREAVLEEARQQVLVVGQRDDAVADVARRQHAELAPQASGGAAVVGDGDDAGELAQPRAAHLVLEAAQQRRQPGAAADRHQGAGARRFHSLLHRIHRRAATAS